MEMVAWLSLFMPLAGFLGILSTSRMISRKLTGIVGCATVLISFICFVLLLIDYHQNDADYLSFTLFKWIHVQGIDADISIHLDPLSLLMALIITGVGFLIHVYSIGYIEYDEDYARYFACMNFFIFSMLLLVLAGNLLLLFIGWEGVGLASYLLIGYYYERPAAAQAATKAFVINRIGDLGFLLGLILTFILFGTTDIKEISQRAVGVGAPIIAILTLLYFLGAIGKSAQLPLYTWLPDAMEGPTPVSALIHAATMVTAGVYLVVRMHDLFILVPSVLYLVGIVGGVTSLFAAVAAIGQTDLKRVLAYSTISQLGLMFLACGVGAFYAAMFHLTTHAFIKALLFLSAGNVVHMMHGTTEMEKMGGLSKKFPITHWFFLIGALALSGIPPFAAFFSKDLILEEEYTEGFIVLFAIGLTTSILTGFYLIRAYCFTFLGIPRIEEKILKTIKEAPKIMLLPQSILLLLTIVGGFLGFAFNQIPILEKFLQEGAVTDPHLSGNFIFSWETLVSIIGVFISVALSFYLYTRHSEKIKHPILLLKNAFYINQIYWSAIALPLKNFSLWIANKVEPNIFDYSIDRISFAAQKSSRWLQQMQSGQIRSYMAWMVLGMVALLVLFVSVPLLIS